MMNEFKKSEPSRHFSDFHLAGFAYWEGIHVAEELNWGKPVTLQAEPDNPHDPEAVAVYYQDKKIGYVPRGKNQVLSQFLYYGYGEMFEAFIQAVNKESHPERQFRVVVMLKDGRK
ncbi:HIRAN domain-containing protein [Enterococcus sp. HY326]|uniref:HIRAN domain-containing protein n=1 Tax=Enterococcus sp. HY326 TaxID=2971265 RepID=UPI003A0FE8F5